MLEEVREEVWVEEEAEWEAIGLEQGQLDIVFVQTVERRLNINQEYRAILFNALNAVIQ